LARMGRWQVIVVEEGRKPQEQTRRNRSRTGARSRSIGCGCAGSTSVSHPPQPASTRPTPSDSPLRHATRRLHRTRDQASPKPDPRTSGTRAPAPHPAERARPAVQSTDGGSARHPRPTLSSYPHQSRRAFGADLWTRTRGMGQRYGYMHSYAFSRPRRAYGQTST
jgi:hypothetical protein